MAAVSGRNCFSHWLHGFKSATLWIAFVVKLLLLLVKDRGDNLIKLMVGFLGCFFSFSLSFGINRELVKFRAVFKWLSKVITWLRLKRLWLAWKTRASFSTNEKQNQNQSHHVRVIFPALRASYRWLLGIVIGSSRCSFLLWLVAVIALVLVFQQSFENRSITVKR